MIAIIDYGMGNLHSVYNALKNIQCECKITSEESDLRAADGLILPGVGAFYDCMKNLDKSGLIPTIKEEVAKGKPLLGICLGMQILFEKGYEVKTCEGLGFLQGEVCLMKEDTVKIPHIGWNRLEIRKQDVLLSTFDKSPFVYFVHSYYAQHYQWQEVIAYAEYGSLNIPAYVRKDNIMGMQYHPEKSGKEGLAMLKQFQLMCEREGELL